MTINKCSMKLELIPNLTSEKILHMVSKKVSQIHKMLVLFIRIRNVAALAGAWLRRRCRSIFDLSYNCLPEIKVMEPVNNY